MKTKYFKLLIILIACSIDGVLLRGQGTFQNLDFESANLPDVPQGQYGSEVQISDGLPNWSGYLGPNQQSQVLHNNETLGNASISILGPNWPALNILEGNYSVLLQPGSGPTGMHVGAAIVQTGMFPSAAQSLRFLSSLDPIAGQLELTIDGQTLSFFPLSSGANYTVYGSDISAFDDQMHELRFTAPYTGTGPNNVYLDAISFSSEAIPEPGVFGLFAFGALLLAWRFVRRG